MKCPFRTTKIVKTTIGDNPFHPAYGKPVNVEESIEFQPCLGIDCPYNAVLVNIQHITEVRGNIVYMDDAIPTSTDFSHIHCKEDYLEIAEKIKEAAGGD